MPCRTHCSRSTATHSVRRSVAANLGSRRSLPDPPQTARPLSAGRCRNGCRDPGAMPLSLLRAHPGPGRSFRTSLALVLILVAKAATLCRGEPAGRQVRRMAARVARPAGSAPWAPQRRLPQFIPQKAQFVAPHWHRWAACPTLQSVARCPGESGGRQDETFNATVAEPVCGTRFCRQRAAGAGQ